MIVGTPGLGYPLLLCLDKSLVVIFNYALTAEQPDPCGPEPCPLDNGPGPVPRLGKVREHRVFRKRQALSPSNRKLRTSRGGPDPRGVPDPPWGPGPPV